MKDRNDTTVIDGRKKGRTKTVGPELVRTVKEGPERNHGMRPTDR